MKNVSCFITTILTVLIISSCSDKTSIKPNKIYDASNKEMLANQNETLNDVEFDANAQLKANEYLQKIYDAFGSTPGRTKNEISDYPGYYGGAFINYQGKLVVYIKGDVPKYKKSIQNIIGNDDFITQPCQHSFKSLTKVMSDLNLFKLNKANKELSKNINAYALMDGKNQVTVELEEFNEMKIAEFKKYVMNSPTIVFEKSSGKLVEEESLNPGCKAEVSSSGSYGSFAFRARRNSDGKYGMVTAGHVISVGGNFIL